MTTQNKIPLNATAGTAGKPAWTETVRQMCEEGDPRHDGGTPPSDQPHKRQERAHTPFEQAAEVISKGISDTMPTFDEACSHPAVKEIISERDDLLRQRDELKDFALAFSATIFSESDNPQQVLREIVKFKRQARAAIAATDKGEQCVECGKDSWTCEHYREERDQ